VDATSFFLSPLGLAATYLWTFASLAAVQLTVRLILRFDIRETALAALWLCAAVVVVSLLYLQVSAAAVDPAVVERLRQQGEAAGVGTLAVQSYVVQQRLVWLPVAALALAAISWVVARRVLGMRPRSAVIAALALGVLVAPWPALLFV
jgi:hypothetical protein